MKRKIEEIQENEINNEDNKKILKEVDGNEEDLIKLFIEIIELIEKYEKIFEFVKTIEYNDIKRTIEWIEELENYKNHENYKSLRKIIYKENDFNDDEVLKFLKSKQSNENIFKYLEKSNNINDLRKELENLLYKIKDLKQLHYDKKNIYYNRFCHVDNHDMKNDKIEWQKEPRERENIILIPSISIYQLFYSVNIEKTRDFIQKCFNIEWNEEEDAVIDSYTGLCYKHFWDYYEGKIVHDNYKNKCVIMDEMFKKIDYVSKEIILFEGQSGGCYEEIENYEVDQEYERKRISSTSFSPLVAAHFSKEGNWKTNYGNIIKYYIKGDIKGILVDSSFKDGGKMEYEIILQPNIKFKVLSKKKEIFFHRLLYREGCSSGFSEITIYEFEIIN
jgi:hypothetical protein